MPALANNLWGQLPTLANVKTPLSVLREQGRILEQQTMGMLAGLITTRTNSNGELVHAFYIQAPLLADYSHLLLSVVHSAPTFPLRIEFQGKKIPVKSIDAFERALGGLLKNPSTTSVITSLLAESSAVANFQASGKPKANLNYK